MMEQCPCCLAQQDEILATQKIGSVSTQHRRWQLSLLLQWRGNLVLLQMLPSLLLQTRKEQLYAAAWPGAKLGTRRHSNVFPC
jgi:hypothetical protein